MLFSPIRHRGRLYAKRPVWCPQPRPQYSLGEADNHLPIHQRDLKGRMPERSEWLLAEGVAKRNPRYRNILRDASERRENQLPWLQRYLSMPRFNKNTAVANWNNTLRVYLFRNLINTNKCLIYPRI